MLIKVTDVGTNFKALCDFLLVTNTNWHPILYHFQVIADYCLNLGHFAILDPLRGNVNCSSWKARIGLPIELFFARCYS